MSRSGMLLRPVSGSEGIPVPANATSAGTSSLPARPARARRKAPPNVTPPRSIAALQTGVPGDRPYSSRRVPSMSATRIGRDGGVARKLAAASSAAAAIVQADRGIPAAVKRPA